MTGLGVVVTVDSQPTLITEGRVMTRRAPLDRPRMVTRVGHHFIGFVTFVGTEFIGDVPVGVFLERHSRTHEEQPVGEYVHLLARDLSEAWKEHGLTSGLYVHVAGVADREPQFLVVRNIGGMDGMAYVNIVQDFHAVDDLHVNLIPQWVRPGETKMGFLARGNGYLRNGSLAGVLEPFDDFNALMTKLYDGRYSGFNRFTSIQSYGALVRMRSEFVKRIFNNSKGLYVGDVPINGPVHVVAVDLDGDRWRIPVKDSPRRVR